VKKLLHGEFCRASFVISLSVAESLNLRRPAIQELDNLLKSRQRKLADRSILGYHERPSSESRQLPLAGFMNSAMCCKRGMNDPPASAGGIAWFFQAVTSAFYSGDQLGSPFGG
jgi:hypothetical protein